MAPGRDPSKRRQRGWIAELPSGSFRVRVYAGVDPLAGSNHYLRETVGTRREAERTRTRLLSQVDENRNPRTARP
jgi:integrase